MWIARDPPLRLQSLWERQLRRRVHHEGHILSWYRLRGILARGEQALRAAVTLGMMEMSIRQSHWETGRTAGRCSRVSKPSSGLSMPVGLTVLSFAVRCYLCVYVTDSWAMYLHRPWMIPQAVALVGDREGVVIVLALNAG
jgi:hypothetical protein